MVLNGQTKEIRSNLGEAIRHIRSDKFIVPLWIDAVSINQNDAIERGRQVRRMGEIYDHATLVYSWTGPGTGDTQEANELMRELYKHPFVRFNNEGEYHFGEWGSAGGGQMWYGENKIRPPKLARLCASLYKFLTRGYFRRSWILQVCSHDKLRFMRC